MHEDCDNRGGACSKCRGGCQHEEDIRRGVKFCPLCRERILPEKKKEPDSTPG